MNQLNYPETTKWVVAYNNTGIFHTCYVEPQNCFSTGQPFLEIFDTQEELLSAFPNLSLCYCGPAIFDEFEPDLV